MRNLVVRELLVSQVTDKIRYSLAPLDNVLAQFPELQIDVGFQSGFTSRLILSATGFRKPPGVTTSTRFPSSSANSSSSSIK